MSGEVETTLFRVVQEAINNIVRHAGAENVAINLEFRPNSVSAEIEDDGKGFEAEGVRSASVDGRGLGLLGMKERIELLGGTFRLESKPNYGARVWFEVPV